MNYMTVAVSYLLFTVCTQRGMHSIHECVMVIPIHKM